MYLRATMILWVIWGAYWLARAFGGARTTASESFLARVSHLLPLVLGFVLLYSGDHQAANPVVGTFGVLCVAAGLVFAFWARGHLGKYWSGIITLKEGHRLIRTGPYRYARHPIYTGVLLAFFGSALVRGDPRGALAFVIVAVAFYVKSRREEKNLLAHFGDEYVRFQREVKALVPFVF